MTAVCAWCQKVIGKIAARPGAVSHGICPECASRELGIEQPAGKGERVPALSLQPSRT